jgi:quinol monooxygenase YgiN
MAIYESGAYQIKPSAIGRVKRAIEEFVEYLRKNESGTEMYLAWQEKEAPERFLHLFRFRDREASERHGESEAVKKFESVYRPDLVGGEVVFTEYEMVAGKLPPASGEAEQEGGVQRNDSGTILKNFYDAAIRRDFETLRSFIHDELVFVGIFETYRSAEQYLDAFKGLLSITERLEVKKIMAQGNDAAIFFELQTRAPAEATVLVAEWHHFEGGKIARVESAFDARPYEAMFKGESAA